MMNFNPYTPPTIAREGLNTNDQTGVIRRILWSAGCLTIGAGLSWGLPLLLIVFGIWRSKGDLSGLVILIKCQYASILTGLVGMVSGGRYPGRYAILITLASLVLADLIALTMCFDTSRHDSTNQQFVLLYLTSAVTTVIAMILVVPKHETLLKYLITITGAVLLLFIAAWIAK